jgi:hypothetical protein
MNKSLVVLGLLLTSFVAHAQVVLYGTIGSGATPSTLVELDPATGSVMQTIGPVGYVVNGLTFDSSTQVLYASTSQGDSVCPRGLITINRTTGAGTVVGCGPTSGETPSLLASNTAGQLYSWLEPNTDDLISWDKATGVYSAPIGDAGLSTGGHTLAFDNGNVLYLLNSGGELYTISTTTGASTLVSSGVATGHHGDFHPTTNLLYVISSTGDPRNIRVIDVATGSQMSEFAAPNGLHTLAFSSPAAQPPVSAVAVPTLSQWALLALGLLVAAAAMTFRRRA